jgi:hypothetical protein
VVISRPTTKQLIDTVCAELTDKVAPAIDDPVVKVQLDMAISVLQTTAVRCANEIAWMREERDAIEEAARGMAAALPEAAELASAFQAYLDGKSDSLYLDEAQAEYARASEVLSCAAEAAFASGDAGHIATVGRLIDQRHANQQAVTGQFMALGRT